MAKRYRLWILVGLALATLSLLGCGWLSFKPSIAREMHPVKWTEADAKSWQDKNDRFTAEVAEAHRTGAKKDVQLVLTEAEATAIANKTLEQLLSDDSPGSLKQQIIDASGGRITGASDIQINYKDGATLWSAAVQFQGRSIPIAARQHKEIINGHPREVIDQTQIGGVPLLDKVLDEVKNEALKYVGSDLAGTTINLGKNRFVLLGLDISDGKIMIDYNRVGVTDYLQLKSTTTEQGLLTLKGTTK